MKMLNYLKNILYDLIVWSGFVIYLIPVLKPFIKLKMSKQSNHVVKDASGATIYVSKVKGRLYIPNTEHRILSVPNIRIRTTDVLLCGYPKTGCHWMHEMIHMLLNRKAALTKHGKELGGMIDIIPDIILDSLPSPRVLNSHLLYEELPKGVREKKIKIVYTVRNPKDTLVSYYNHHLNLKEMYRYSGNINDYYQLFMEGNLDFGSYFDHVLAWDAAVRNLKDNPVLLVTFEEITSDPLEIVRRVAAFLGIAVTEKFAADVADACSFNKMKATREKGGHFDARLFRKGKSARCFLKWLVGRSSGKIQWGGNGKKK